MTFVCVGARDWSKAPGGIETTALVINEMAKDQNYPIEHLFKGKNAIISALGDVVKYHFKYKELGVVFSHGAVYSFFFGLYKLVNPKFYLIYQHHVRNSRNKSDYNKFKRILLRLFEDCSYWLADETWFMNDHMKESFFDTKSVIFSYQGAHAHYLEKRAKRLEELEKPKTLEEIFELVKKK